MKINLLILALIIFLSVLESLYIPELIFHEIIFCNIGFTSNIKYLDGNINVSDKKILKTIFYKVDLEISNNPKI